MLKGLNESYGETKPGIKTSEFLLTVLFNVAVFCAAMADALPGKWSAGLSAVSIALYSLSRGQAKKGVGANPSIKQ